MLEGKAAKVKTGRTDSGIAYRSKKGAILGKGSHIKTAKQARRVVESLRDQRQAG